MSEIDYRKLGAELVRRVKTQSAMPFASSRWSFFTQWVRYPRKVGSLVPSGGRLAQTMASLIDWQRPGHIVEIGAGSGAITEKILSHPQAAHRTLIVEQDANFYAQLTQRFPRAHIVQADARHLAELFRKHKVKTVNAVVSSIPMLMLSWEDQYQIIAQALSMGSNTKFIQFTYNLISSPITLKGLHKHGIFGEKQNSIVLSNFPPAAVWVYYYQPKSSGFEQPREQ